MPLNAAILLSRQSLRPCAADPWVRQASRAVDWLASEGHDLVASVGMNTWELPLALASARRVATTVILPTNRAKDASSDALIRQFDLDPARACFLPLEEENADASKHALMQRRDAVVVEATDVLIPISVREDGSMDRLIAEAESAGKRVERSFQIAYDGASRRLGYEIDPTELSPEAVSLESKLLTHWTRSSDGPWPTERSIDYYLALTGSVKYPRNAYHTLRNIVTSGRIVASERHMPDGARTVSFSALAPCEAAPLMRWRARYRQMSFEPYGIGFPRALAEELGVKSVIYTKDTDGVDRWRTQSPGRITDWRQEREFRFPNDFDLAAVPRNQLVCFCRDHDEAKRLSDQTGLRTIPMTSTMSDAP